MSWAPSRKWAVTQVTALAALAVAWVQSDGWSDTLTIMGIGIASQAIIAYLVPNATIDPEPVPVEVVPPAEPLVGDEPVQPQPILPFEEPTGPTTVTSNPTLPPTG